MHFVVGDGIKQGKVMSKKKREKKIKKKSFKKMRRKFPCIYIAS